MKGLFRAFEREGVDYLLIGGQAAILYGAAHFTQDLDVWIRPTPRNVRAFLHALARVEARIQKLTPPISLRWIRRGHGFHFTIPQKGQMPAYLDAMGRPSRASSFASARSRARRMKTPWGTLPVVAIEDLVELRKTNRPGDYEIISRLVRIRLAEIQAPTPRQVHWALQNTFRVEDGEAILALFGRRSHRRPAAGGRTLDRKMARLLEQGREYGLPRLRELRELRAKGGLLPAGARVSEIH